MKKILTQLALYCLLVTGFIKAQAPQLGKSSVKDVVAAMTLEEKAKFVVGNGFNMPGSKKDSTYLGVTKDRVPGAA